MRTLMTMVVTVGIGTSAVLADERCMYANQLMSPGEVSCQGGMQFRCAHGSWQDTGLHCADTTGDEEGLQVDPSRKAPRVREPGVAQPSAPHN